MSELAEIRGQDSAKRALEIAAAGGHHILLVGPPGSGKTMLGRCLPRLLPGRPFREPPSTLGVTALLSEVERTRHGVLFLDEVHQFRRDVLEALRKPMEDPRFLLIATANPCGCGHLLSLTLKAPIPHPAGYPENPKTLGEHVRKVRMDRGVLQKDLADQVGVSVESLGSWETTSRQMSSPSVVAKLIAFLGFDPRPAGSTFGERLKRKRTSEGMTQRELAECLGVDPTSVGRVERDGNIGGKLTRIFQEYLTGDKRDFGELGD